MGIGVTLQVPGSQTVVEVIQIIAKFPVLEHIGQIDAQVSSMVSAMQKPPVEGLGHSVFGAIHTLTMTSKL